MIYTTKDTAKNGNHNYKTQKMRETQKVVKDWHFRIYHSISKRGKEEKKREHLFLLFGNLICQQGISTRKNWANYFCLAAGVVFPSCLDTSTVISGSFPPCLPPWITVPAIASGYEIASATRSKSAKSWFDLPSILFYFLVHFQAAYVPKLQS